MSLDSKIGASKILDIDDHRYVYFFGEGSKELIALLGGKGAVLNEMIKLGLQVPHGFTITTEACKEFQQTGKLPDNVKKQADKALSKLEETTGKTFGGENPLFVSVRSGAKISMPGMMDTILNIGLNDGTVESLARATGSEEFAYGSYKRLMEMFADVVLGIPLKETRAYLSNSQLIMEKSADIAMDYALKDAKNVNKLKKAITKKIIAEIGKSEDFVKKVEEIDRELDHEDWLKKVSQIIKKAGWENEITDPAEIKAKAKVGMEVEAIDGERKGLKGIIKAIDNSVGVEFEKDFGGHSLSGEAKEGHGWWIGYGEIKLLCKVVEEGQENKLAKLTALLEEANQPENKDDTNTKKLDTQQSLYDSIIDYIKNFDKGKAEKKEDKYSAITKTNYDKWKNVFGKPSIKELFVKEEITDLDAILKQGKEGDRVIGKGSFEGKTVEGIKGTIKKLGSSPHFGVEWDENIGGHGYFGKDGHCWWVPAPSIYLQKKEGLDVKKIIAEAEQELISEFFKTKREPKLDIGLLKQFIASKGKYFPQDVNEQLALAINAVFESWNNARAIEYRKINNIPDDLGTAANVQSMVFGNMGDDSATGVIFTRRPTDGKKELYGEYLTKAQGEDVVAGIRTPSQISELKKEHPKIYEQLKAIATTLENYFRDMQDIEFTVEKGKLWMLQARNGKRTALASINIAADMADEGLITREEAIMRVNPFVLETLCTEMIDPAANYSVLTKGSGASPGIVSGVIALTSEKAKELAKENKKCILVREDTNPNDIEGIAASVGIITNTGGATSHAALVTRAMNKACVTGCGNIEIYQDKLVVKGKEFYEGETISIDGTSGEVIEGEVKVERSDKNSKLEMLVKWAAEISDINPLINADTPADIKKALQMGYKEISLCRTEHLFFTNGNLDLVRDYTVAEEDSEKKRILGELKRKQEKAFKEILEAAGKSKIRIRLLSSSLDRFLPSKREIEYLKRRVQEEDVPLTKTKVSTKCIKREGNVGDKIVINEEGNGHYACTKSGSEGEIIAVGNNVYSIKFTKLTGGEYELPATFDINKDDVDIVSLEEMSYFEILKKVITLAYENESNKANKRRNKKVLENIENRARRQRDVYDSKEMEDLYFMQVQAITEAYSRTGCKADIEILVPDFVPQNTRSQLQNQLQNIIGGQKITINPNSSSVYFIKDVKTALKEKDRMQEAEYIVAPPKKVQSAQIILAQYAIKKGENKNENK